MVYCTGSSVRLRRSKDLRTWSQPRAILTLDDGIAPESPTLVRHEDTFYLFVCGWDGHWDQKSVQGAYQHQTLVFQSDNGLHFENAKAIATLQAHAPEVIRGEDGEWYISSAEWPRRGISVARLAWH